MIVKCWNCGNDHEVSVEQARAQERQRVIEALRREAEISGTCGDIYRHNAYMSAISMIEHL